MNRIKKRTRIVKENMLLLKKYQNAYSIDGEAPSFNRAVVGRKLPKEKFAANSAPKMLATKGKNPKNIAWTFFWLLNSAISKMAKAIGRPSSLQKVPNVRISDIGRMVFGSILTLRVRHSPNTKKKLW
jgi:hypothetical protein